MDTGALGEFLDRAWRFDAEKGPLVRALEDYIAIPNDSPNFDPDWAAKRVAGLRRETRS